MAVARKCDICGKYYESYGVASCPSEARTMHNGINFVSISDKRSYYDGRPIDCCRECLESIKNHIESLRGE